MTKKEFFRGLTGGKSDILQELLDIFTSEKIDYCLIGGLAVNAYVEPVVSLDLDVVVAAGEINRLKKVAMEKFTFKEFPHSINFYREDSDLRIQIQTDERYQEFIDRARDHVVFGYSLKVAALPDVLQGKIWAYSDEARRKSKRQKDLADILRIIENFPELESHLPESIRRKIE